MRKLFILIGVLLPGILFAQSEAIVKSQAIIRSKVDTGKEPLYILNGKEIPDIKNINPDSISSIDVLKGESATLIYGQRAVNGVVIIHTKVSSKSIVLPPKADTLYVVDGVVTNNISAIDPNEILEISVLKSLAGPNVFPERDKPAVLIVTKKGAKAAYQNKLGQLCEKYKSYITVHRGDDTDIKYKLDGLVLLDKAKALMDLKTEDIKSVSFDLVNEGSYAGQTPVVSITTKKLKSVLKP